MLFWVVQSFVGRLVVLAAQLPPLGPALVCCRCQQTTAHADRSRFQPGFTSKTFAPTCRDQSF
eukprot:5527147-Amphidinium_carterae.1